MEINEINLSNDSKLIPLEKDPFSFHKENVKIDISKIHSEIKVNEKCIDDNSKMEINFTFHIWKYTNSYFIALSFNETNKIGSLYRFNYEIYQKDKLFDNQIEDIIDEEENNDLMNDFFNKAMNINETKDVNVDKISDSINDKIDKKEEDFNIIEEYYITQVLGNRNNELNSFFVTLLISDLTNKKKIFEFDKKKTSILVSIDFDISTIVNLVKKLCLTENIEDNLLRVYIFEYLIDSLSHLVRKSQL